MRKRITLVFIGMILFVLSACTAVQPEPAEATQPPATAVPTVTSTGIPTDPPPVPTTIAPVTDDDLAVFIERLEAAVTNQGYAAMQAYMSDPLAVGAWRSEWRMAEPAQVIEQFQNASLPAPLAVQFTDLSEDEITDLIGQPPASLLAPDVNVAAALHSTGWGQSGRDEAILFVVAADGRYTWSAFLYTNGRFADAAMGTTAPPVGLIYRMVDDGLYQIQADGQSRQLLDQTTAGTPNLQISPDGRQAAYLTEDNQLWLVNTASGSQQQMAAEFDLSGFLMWADKETLFVGVWLDPNEAEGPNNGHVATLDTNSGTVQIFDEEHLSGNRPALLSNYNMVAFDVFTPSPNGRTYHPDSGVQIFDPATYTGSSEMLQGGLLNPAWSPNADKIAWIVSTGERFAVQVFDLETKTAVQLLDWDPARFGGLVPSPIWNPEGDWLALEVLANGPEGSGVWVLAADGREQTLIDAEGHMPHWVNGTQLVLQVNDEPRLYDLDNGEQFRLDLPANSAIVRFTNPADLLVASESVPAAEPTPDEDTELPIDLPDPAALDTVSEVTISSPDGRWQATARQTEPVVAGEAERLYVDLSVTSGTTTWQPVAEWRAYGLGYIWPAVVQWSADSRHLYYTNIASADGCAIFVNGTDLYRLDVTDGSVIEILPAGSTFNLSLLPDETRVAYIAYNGRQNLFALRDIASGAEQSVALTAADERVQVGEMFWSADGETAVFTLVHNACLPSETTSIIRIDTDTVTAVTLIEKDERRLYVSEWADPAQSEISLVDKDNQFWSLDIDSGELSQSD